MASETGPHGGHRPADLAAAPADYRAAEREPRSRRRSKAGPGSGPGASLRRPRTEPRRGPKILHVLRSARPDEAFGIVARTARGCLSRWTFSVAAAILPVVRPRVGSRPPPRRASLFGAPVTTVAARGGFVARGPPPARSPAGARASSERAPVVGVAGPFVRRDVRAAKGGGGARTRGPRRGPPRERRRPGITALGFVSPDGGGGSTTSPAGSETRPYAPVDLERLLLLLRPRPRPSERRGPFLVVGGTRGGGGGDAATGACVLASPGSHAGAVTSARRGGGRPPRAADDASDVGGGGFGTNLSPALFRSDSPRPARRSALGRAGAQVSATGHRGGVRLWLWAGRVRRVFGDPLVSSNSRWPPPSPATARGRRRGLAARGRRRDGGGAEGARRGGDVRRAGRVPGGRVRLGRGGGALRLDGGNRR